MSRFVKQLVTKDLKKRYCGVTSACVVGVSGLNVQEQESLRRTLRDKSARLQVVKNSLARRAFEDGPLSPLGKALEGPCALVVADDSPINLAKTLVAAAAEFKKLVLRRAIYDGDPALLTVEELAKMRGREEILGEVAFLVSSPGRAIAGCLRSPQSKIAGCLKAMIEKAA